MNIEQFNQHKNHFAVFRNLPSEVMEEIFSMAESTLNEATPAVERPKQKSKEVSTSDSLPVQQ